MHARYAVLCSCKAKSACQGDASDWLPGTAPASAAAAGLGLGSVPSASAAGRELPCRGAELCCWVESPLGCDVDAKLPEEALVTS